AGEFQAQLTHLPGDVRQAGGLDLVAPGRDRPDALARAGVEDAAQRQVDAAALADGGGVDREPAVVLRKVAHHATPCSASSVRMRAAARSGCSSRLAASARRNSSAKCGRL